MSTEQPAEQESAQRPIALGIALTAGVITMILRVVPHPPNFSGIGGLGLFGGARLPAWKAYAFPLGILILSDLVLWVCTGFNFMYSLGHVSRFYVYASFMIYVFIGRWLADKNSARSIVIAGVAGSLQFFIITNFCVWLFQPFEADVILRYSRDFDGLVACYIAALGFAQNENAVVLHPFMMFTDFRLGLPWMIVGDIFFTGVYLLAYAKLARRRSTMPAAMEMPT